GGYVIMYDKKGD
ncbi:MAG: hypothetical protein EZS28_053217, partial [Streblomastix strix]